MPGEAVEKSWAAQCEQVVMPRISQVLTDDLLGCSFRFGSSFVFFVRHRAPLQVRHRAILLGRRAPCCVSLRVLRGLLRVLLDHLCGRNRDLRGRALLLLLGPDVVVEKRAKVLR
eukprot:s2960_g5.t1